MESPDYTFDESDIVGIPMPPPKKPRAKKPDNRSVSSKANIVKALQAKKRQKEEEFEIEEVSDSGSESDSEEEVVRKAKTKAKAKKQMKEKQQNLYTEQQMGELRHIVSQLAKAQKKSNRQKKKTIIQMPQPQPPQIQHAGKKEPDVKTEQLKQSILRF